MQRLKDLLPAVAVLAVLIGACVWIWAAVAQARHTPVGARL